VKNLSLILNVVLLVAVGALYFMHFSENPDKEQESPEVTERAGYAVAYINSDSVLQNYDYFKKMQEDLEGKTAKLEAEYQNRAQGLQKEITDYQQNQGNLTIGQAQALEQNLRQKQQNLQLYQQKLTQDLMAEENKMSQELYKKITDYLKQYGESNDLQMVVRFNQGSDVLYATDGMDITQSVITGLNEEYNTSLNQTPADSTAAE
jgi:outer membrane protein